jgi:hypothetical protein
MLTPTHTQSTPIAVGHPSAITRINIPGRVVIIKKDTFSVNIILIPYDS